MVEAAGSLGMQVFMQSTRREEGWVDAAARIACSLGCVKVLAE